MSAVPKHKTYSIWYSKATLQPRYNSFETKTSSDLQLRWLLDSVALSPLGKLPFLSVMCFLAFSSFPQVSFFFKAFCALSFLLPCLLLSVRGQYQIRCSPPWLIILVLGLCTHHDFTCASKSLAEPHSSTRRPEMFA